MDHISTLFVTVIVNLQLLLFNFNSHYRTPQLRIHNVTDFILKLIFEQKYLLEIKHSFLYSSDSTKKYKKQSANRESKGTDNSMRAGYRLSKKKCMLYNFSTKPEFFINNFMAEDRNKSNI